MAIYCNKCGATHDCSVCPICHGLGKTVMTTDELRAKFEAWIIQGDTSLERYSNGEYMDKYTRLAWAIWQAAHASRDAEVEALQRKAFALDALVAAGFVTETKLAESLKIADAAMREKT